VQHSELSVGNVGEVKMIRLAVLLVLLSAAEISTEGYVVVDPPEAVVCEMGWCYVLEPEMTWRVN